MSAYYARSRPRQTQSRIEIGLAAEAIREELHFSKLAGPITLSSAADMARSLGQKLDELMHLIARECEAGAFAGEPFYDGGDEIAIHFDERRQERRIAEDSDERTDRGCWEAHERSGA